ncbi:hypothetical protein CspeluHIS016_0204350 [Cutaneotrichosporon spelunceum]|uniref:Uncharacterized protein n=1 Tax=Cutaneotrichosporon spelunceum TaxID=1672016 RepID=A0AAD3TRF7_9TREE|nr:hypothetical protein CspeluHIS016_0204350 [Cutaneotrichosporon spelunceum]
MPSSSALFYAALAVVSAAVIHGYAFRLPGFVNATELLSTKACFSQPNARHLPIHHALDQAACAITSSFQAVQGPGRILANALGALLVSATTVMVYESLRPVHTLTKAGTLARGASTFMLLAQVLGAACYAAFFLAASLSTASGGRIAHSLATKAPKPGKALLGYALPTPPRVWGVLVALLGYILLSLPLIRGWGYTATTIWQIFPLFVLVLAAFSPSIIAALFPWARTDGSRAFAIVALTVAGVIPSLVAHIRLIPSLTDALLLRAQPHPESLGHAMHVLLLADLVVIAIANASYVLTADGGSGPDVRGRFLLFALLTLVVGPGGALALMWGYREICLAFAYERIDQGEAVRLEEDESAIEK